MTRHRREHAGIGSRASYAPRNRVERCINRLKDGAPLAFAGPWEGWRSPDGEVVRTFAILTTGSNTTLSRQHERMPVSLEPDAWAAWLD